MKNILLFPLLFICFAAFAQEKTETTRPFSQISMEIMGGLTLSKMPIHFEEAPDRPGLPGFKSQTGFFVGIAGRIECSSKWALRVEGQYAQKGYGYQYYTDVVRNRIDYVDVMPQIEFQIIPKLSVSLGGYAAIRMAARQQLTDGGKWEKIQDDFVPIRAADFGLVSGLTGHFGRFRAYARYQYGLYDIDQIEYSNDVGMNINTSQYNRTIQLGVGYSIL